MADEPMDMDASIAAALEGLGDEGLAFDDGGLSETPDARRQTPVTAGQEQEGESEAVSPPEAETAAEDESLFALPDEEPEEEPLFRWEELPDDPAVQKLAKGLQGDYTRKTQQLAEQRKALEAERAAYQRYEQYEQLRRQNPAAAAQILQQELQALQGGSAPHTAHSAQPDPLNGFEPETTNEQVLADVIRSQHQQIYSFQQQQQLLEQQRQQEAQRQAQAQLDQELQAEIKAVEGKLKKPLTPAQIDQIARYANENAFGRFDKAFESMYHAQLVEHAKKQARDEAIKELSRKSLQSAMPAGAPPRERSEPEPKDADAIIWNALRQHGLAR
jgi:hypothetical protein